MKDTAALSLVCPACGRWLSVPPGEGEVEVSCPACQRRWQWSCRHRLVASVYRHTLPLGPMGDLEARRRQEQEWLASLTAADVLELLAWIESPESPPGWRPLSPAEEKSLCTEAIHYAAEAGRRLHDERIRHQLERLLHIPRFHHEALEGLGELGDPAAYPAVLGCLDGPTPGRYREGIYLEMIADALASMADPEMLGKLRVFLQQRGEEARVQSFKRCLALSLAEVAASKPQLRDAAAALPLQ